ncbi:DNA cytosine methyltransferase [Lactococcus lactis]
MKKLCPNLFYDSLFQLNAKTNYDILRKYLSKNNNLKDELKNEKWLKFTNKQLSLLFIYSQSEEYGFNKALKSLSQRIKLGKKETIEFWDYVSSKINQELTEEVYLESLKRGLIDDKMAEAIFTKKNIRVRLDAKSSAPTMVTLPDDFIHPYFNRVLTVREMARLQSFDDSFQFLGKRTTGGDKRSQETPQFTQVGNAVPPLLAKSIAEEVYIALEKVEVK